MVRIFALMLICASLPAATPAFAQAPAPAEVPSALKSGGYPWYDAVADRIKPVDLPSEPAPTPPKSSGTTRTYNGIWSWVGYVLQMLGFALMIAVVLGLLIWLYKVYEPSAEVGVADAPPGRGTITQVGEELPAGLRDEFRSSDPWDEAIRRRQRGDLAGAVVCLFAHQLLTLSRLGLVRLAPGRTARQLVRGVADLEFRGLVHPTLRLFEQAYYGHQEPTREAFDDLWGRAEAFERRVATGGTRA